MDQTDRASKLRNILKLKLSDFQSCAGHLTTNSFCDSFISSMHVYLCNCKSTESCNCFMNMVAEFLDA